MKASEVKQHNLGGPTGAAFGKNTFSAGDATSGGIGGPPNGTTGRIKDGPPIPFDAYRGVQTPVAETKLPSP